MRLIRPREEAPEIRHHAMQALGNIRDPKTAGAIADSILNDPDDTVKLDAIRALGSVAPTQAQLGVLKPIFKDNRPDPSLRNAAWDVLQSSLDGLTKVQLTDWADHFSGDPQKQIIVRKKLAEKLTADGELKELADVQEQIADNYMELDPPDPESAVASYRPALDFRLGPAAGPGARVQVESLIARYMKALLRSGKYVEAVAFAREMIQKDAGQQRTMGVLIKDEADRLAEGNSIDKLKKAHDLIAQTLKMDPPLPDKYSEPLRQLLDSVDKRIEALNRPPGTGPRSASIPFIPLPDGSLIAIT
jgi:hypothetical protein